MQWVEARDVAKYPSVPRMAPGADGDLGLNSSSAAVEKSWCGEAGDLRKRWVCVTFLIYVMVWRHFTELWDS